MCLLLEPSENKLIIIHQHIKKFLYQLLDNSTLEYMTDGPLLTS